VVLLIILGDLCTDLIPSDMAVCIALPTWPVDTDIILPHLFMLEEARVTMDEE
jgi:hypothetical protein